jgi:hypothetical protein
MNSTPIKKEKIFLIDKISVCELFQIFELELIRVDHLLPYTLDNLLRMLADI